MKFTKMHGLGNDFMVIDGINQAFTLSKEEIISLSNRHRGIGFDQLLLIEPSPQPEIDFNYRIFNADGQEVGQCGNGARCLALFAQKYGLTPKKQLNVATRTTLMTLTINNNHTVSVHMGIPKLAPADIPFLAAQQANFYNLLLPSGRTVPIHTINVGNPHALLICDDLNNAPVNELGPQISTHTHFPEQVNVGFMQIIDSEHIELRVYERGCGETQACGSGAAAAAAIGRLFYQLAPQIQVTLKGGNLVIDWLGPNDSLCLTGPATFVYEGELI